MKSKTATSPAWILGITTADGIFVARYSETGLCGLDFPDRHKAAAAPPPCDAPARVRGWHAQTERALKAALEGRPAGKLPPLDLTAGTPFQTQVWEAMRKLGPGETKSYGELARAIGRPKAVRAVGGACGANPIPVLVPCHRVLAANKRLGGFSGGLGWKEKLLEREGVRTG